MRGNDFSERYFSAIAWNGIRIFALVWIPGGRSDRDYPLLDRSSMGEMASCSARILSN